VHLVSAAGRSWCWRGKGSCAWGLRTIKPTKTFGGSSVIIWGSMSALGPGNMCSIFVNVTSYGRANYHGMRTAVTRSKGIRPKIGYPVLEEFLWEAMIFEGESLFWCSLLYTYGDAQNECHPP